MQSEIMRLCSDEEASFSQLGGCAIANFLIERAANPFATSVEQTLGQHRDATFVAFDIANHDLTVSEV
jgi:hypothetical protein